MEPFCFAGRARWRLDCESNAHLSKVDRSDGFYELKGVAVANYRFICTFLLLAAVLALASGCRRRFAETRISTWSEELGTRKATDSAPKIETAKEPFNVDDSVGAAEYIRRGMPSPDRVWSSVDYQNAAEILEDVVDASELPRYRGRTSGVLFGRICDDENLASYRDKKADILRMADCQLCFKRILLVYVRGHVKTQEFGDELVEVMGITLKIAVIMAEKMDEFMATIPKDDPTYPTRRAGMSQMKFGMYQIVTGTLTTLTERESYRVASRLRLAGYLRVTLPDLLPYLTQENQGDVLTHLDQIALKEPNADLKAALEKVSNILQKTKPSKMP